MLFLCPIKREAWIRHLSEFSTQAQWTDAELCRIIALNGHIVIPKDDIAITGEQIVASGLLGVWRAHYACTMDDVDITVPACTATMRAKARQLVAQNKLK
jgi:hypothetical protein